MTAMIGQSDISLEFVIIIMIEKEERKMKEKKNPDVL